MNKMQWKFGDIFLIPLLDGNFSIGHVLDLQMKNIVRMALYAEKVSLSDSLEIDKLCQEKNLISLIASSKEFLDLGAWKIIGNKPSNIPINRYPNEQYRSNKWIGAKHYDASIIEEFINAYFGLSYWDDWADPLYLDKLLINVNVKPKNLLFKKIIPN